MKEAAISVRLDAKIKEAVMRAAADDQRTMASMVGKILADWLKQNGYLKK